VIFDPDFNSLAKSFDYDIGIVGGGIIGLATARELLLRNPALKIAVFEKESKVGNPQIHMQLKLIILLAQHQSKNNSGVIHSGIYYTPGSKRAKLCVDGLKLMYDYVEKNNLPHKRCGKVSPTNRKILINSTDYCIR
jgi:L-2-hydroxyglutarate oxidase LhgO